LLTVAYSVLWYAIATNSLQVCATVIKCIKLYGLSEIEHYRDLIRTLLEMQKAGHHPAIKAI